MKLGYFEKKNLTTMFPAFEKSFSHETENRNSLKKRIWNILFPNNMNLGRRIEKSKIMLMHI